MDQFLDQSLIRGQTGVNRVVDPMVVEPFGFPQLAFQTEAEALRHRAASMVVNRAPNLNPKLWAMRRRQAAVTSPCP